MEPVIQTERPDLAKLSAAVDAVKQEVGKVIVGQSQMIELLLTAILADGHVLIEGVPGVAKTLTAKLLARTIDVHFSRIQFTPDLMPSDVIGTSVFNPQNATFQFKHGPIFSNIVLIDEINRSPAKTQAALFEVMEEKQITVDGVTYPMQPPFLVLATQNPVEQEGTYRLPEAQLGSRGATTRRRDAASDARWHYRRVWEAPGMGEAAGKSGGRRTCASASA